MADFAVTRSGGGMAVFRAALLLGLCVAGQSVVAETGPAELPPADYAGRSYTDSAGCAFQRAGISGTVLWVARIGADKQPVCGLSPTFAPMPQIAEVMGKPAGKARKTTTRADPLQLVGQESLPPGDSLCPAGTTHAIRLWLSDGRRVTRCGANDGDSLATVNGLGLPGLKVAGEKADPSALAAAQGKGAAGYRLVWSGEAAQPSAAQGRWVQVGAFADPANADRVVGRLGELGLGAATQPVKAGRLRAVLAGPFADTASLTYALLLLQGAGFPEAFARP